MIKHCCADMEEHVNRKCDTHGDAWECPDNVIHFHNQKRRPPFNPKYGILIHDGGSSYYTIFFCPWCGTKLREKDEQ